MHRRDHLIAALQGVHPADADEQRALGKLQALLDDDADPFDRERYLPGHVTASAFVLDRSGGRLLLVLHHKLQRWLQPGGHVEPSDDSVWEAAVREVEEETGLSDLVMVGEGLFDVDVHLVAHGGPEHEHFDVRYLMRSASDDALAGDGVDDVRWASLEEMEGMEASLRRPALKALGDRG